MGLMNIGMKRPRETADFDTITAMANCLMLLSGAREFELLSNITKSVTNHHHSPSRVFECKTCNRQFPSFQALGGHRASHKKPKLGGDLSLQSHFQASPPKPKTHECSICGQEFAVGQALGGHMRRHRAAMNEDHHDHDHDHERSPASSSSPPLEAAVASGKKSNKNVTSTAGGKRVWCLDLNLTPLENDDLEFGLGKMVAPCVL